MLPIWVDPSFSCVASTTRQNEIFEKKLRVPVPTAWRIRSLYICCGLRNTTVHSAPIGVGIDWSREAFYMHYGVHNMLSEVVRWHAFIGFGAKHALNDEKQFRSRWQALGIVSSMNPTHKHPSMAFHALAARLISNPPLTSSYCTLVGEWAQWNHDMRGWSVVIDLKHCPWTLCGSQRVESETERRCVNFNAVFPTAGHLGVEPSRVVHRSKCDFKMFYYS